MKRFAMILSVTALLAGGCGSATETTTTGPPPETSPAPSTSETVTTGATTTEGTTTSAPSSTTTATTTTSPTTTAVTTTTLPGEPIEIGPRAGDRVAVVGVAYDDVLNLRLAPGIDQEILAELPPTFDEIVAHGAARKLPSSIWFQVEALGAVGWVSSSYVAYIGPTSDQTSYVVDQVGEIPSAETMLDLADIVAGVMRSEDPPSRVTVTVAPDVGDLGEVTIDIIGLGDDAQFGWRVVIFGQPDGGGEGFSLMSVEATELCSRGLSSDGLCT